MREHFILIGLLAASLAFTACDDTATAESDAYVVTLRNMDAGPGAGGNPGGGSVGFCSAKYEAAGLYAAGMTEIEIDGVPVAIWYPADRAATSGLTRVTYNLRDWLPDETAAQIPDEESPVYTTNAFRDVPVADGPFPVVIFSHGIAGYRFQNSALMDHLASWGYIVASPESPERNLKTVLETGFITGDNAPEMFRATVARLIQENAGNGPLAGRIDESKMATGGHSQGTSAASLVAAEDYITTYFALAGAGFDGPDKPLLYLTGTNDGIATAETVESTFAAQGGVPRHQIGIDRAGHLGFTDICVIGRERGGVFNIALEYGLEVPDLLVSLATDGCEADDLPAEEGFPVINHYVVAHLNYAFGIDRDRAQFSEETRGCFGQRVAEMNSVWRNAGGETGAGGASGAGGEMAMGGASGAGGEPEMGGEPAAGGAAGTGGMSGAGGQPAPGGNIGAGGGMVEPADPRVNRLECKGASGQGPICDTTTQTCCAGFDPEGTCVDGVDNDCSSLALTAPAHCDGPEDCADGLLCCQGFGVGNFCRATLEDCDRPIFGPQVELCHESDDCSTAGAECVTCSPPGSVPGNPPVLVNLCGDPACPTGWTAQ